MSSQFMRAATTSCHFAASRRRASRSVRHCSSVTVVRCQLPFQSAVELQSFSGVAPVTKRSGKQCHVHRRWACPKFLLQTFHEFAHCSCKRSTWAKAFYLQQRSAGKGHHAALRTLAFKWIRILFRCWKTKIPYSEERYLESLRHRNAPLLAFLPATESAGA